MLRRTTLSAMCAASGVLLNKGKVATWLSHKGFGFVVDDADGKQYFVHNSAVQVEAGGYRALVPGQEVEYDIAENRGRMQCENVRAPGGVPLPAGHQPPDFGGRGRGNGFRGRGNGRGGRGGGVESFF